MGSGITDMLPVANGLSRARVESADEMKALKAFDAYFLGEMLKRSAPSNPTGLFDGGQAGRMYQDHLYEEMARLIAEEGDFGIARTLEGRLEGKLGAPEEEPDPVLPEATGEERR